VHERGYGVTSRRRLLQQTLVSSLTWAVAPQRARAAIVPGAGPRTALVIGNDAYRDNPLASAVNDARAMSNLLSRAGFAVDLKLDATHEQMTAAIDGLGRAAARREVGTALFYYAGHAAQLEWRNYLLPVDGNVRSVNDVRAQCIDLGLLLDQLGRKEGKTALIILDACRDDPFGPRFRLPQKGMSQYDAPAGTLLAFATAPGSVALEAPGRPNGLYTENLLRELSAAGVRVEDALKRVRLNVRLASNGRQVPWESTSLENDVYLFPAQAVSETELERQAREELETWKRIKGSSKPDDWIEYLRRFPNGRFAEVAQVHLRRLIASAEPAPARPAPERAALVLGPKVAVPARFKGSGNPHSAGLYPFRPVWTPGDTYVFNELDLYSRVVKRQYSVVVRRVDAAGNRVELADGSVIDLMGGTLREGGTARYEPAIQINPTELQVGLRWSSRFEQSGTMTGSGEYQFRIRERQKVKVPAGEFSAFMIEGTGAFMGRHMQLTRWVVPGLNFSVRSDIRQTGSSRVLVSARQAVSG
jgi:hypothetical protein